MQGPAAHIQVEFGRKASVSTQTCPPHRMQSFSHNPLSFLEALRWQPQAMSFSETDDKARWQNGPTCSYTDTQLLLSPRAQTLSGNGSPATFCFVAGAVPRSHTTALQGPNPFKPLNRQIATPNSRPLLPQPATPTGRINLHKICYPIRRGLCGEFWRGTAWSDNWLLFFWVLWGDTAVPSSPSWASKSKTLA